MKQQSPWEFGKEAAAQAAAISIGVVADQKPTHLPIHPPTHISKGMSEPTRDEIDAKIAGSEARTDTKFAELLGELRVISTRLDHLERSTAGTKSTVVTTGIVTALAIIGVVVSVFAYGSQMFGTGLDADSIARQAASGVQTETAAQISAINARYDRLEADMGALLEAVRAQAGNSSVPE